jgi:hypothetical protein
VNWKDFEILIKENFDGLKVVYSRADKYEGQIAISSFKHNKAQYKELVALKDREVGGKKFTFSELKDDGLNEFW